MGLHLDPFWLRFLPSVIRERLIGRPSVHAALHNSAWLIADKVIRTGVGIFISAWVARYLGPAQFGALTYIITYLTIFYAIVNVRAEGVVVRNLAHNPENASRLLGTLLLMRLLVGCGCVLIALIGLVVMHTAQSNYFLLGILASGILIFQAADVIDLWFQSQVDSKRTIRARLIVYLAISLLKVICILMHAPLTAFALIFSIDLLCSAISLLWVYSRRHSLMSLNFSISLSKDILSESWPFIVAALLLAFANRIDILLIQRYFDQEQIAFYGIAQTFYGLSALLPALLFSSALPALSILRIDDEDKFYDRLQKLYHLAVLWGLSVLVLLYFFAELIISIIYDFAYLPAQSALKILAIASIFTALGVVQGQWVISREGNKLLFINQRLHG
jgi:O-antigen/teichoic acid export membrane protein